MFFRLNKYNIFVNYNSYLYHFLILNIYCLKFFYHNENEILEKEIQNCLSIFTNGKYKQVKINKGGLELWIYSDEKGDWAKPEELSNGAIDEFYLAFRLALVKLIFRDKRPPLLLDDPFVNFDSIRLSNTLSFLKTLTNEYQIIIFTLGDLYDTVADNIIVLGKNERFL